MVVALHRALLHSIQHEPDPLVLAATLRALGTLLLGAPYHRLPPQLLPLCVQALQACLAKATPAAGVGSQGPEQLPVASSCLSCLAAAFSSKASAAALVQLLLPADRGRLSSSGGDGSGEGDSSGNGHQPQQLLRLLFEYASSQQPALQLEAVMALRGVAQQHAALLQGCWERLLAIGRVGAALRAPLVPQSPRGQTGGGSGVSSMLPALLNRLLCVCCPMPSSCFFLLSCLIAFPLAAMAAPGCRRGRRHRA